MPSPRQSRRLPLWLLLVVNAVAVMGITASIPTTATPLSSAAMAWTAAAVAAHAAARLIWQRRTPSAGPSPIVPAVLDLSLTMVVLLLVPILGIPGLFVILLLTARLAALRGFRVAAPLAIAAVLVLVGRVLTLPDVGADTWTLVALFGITAVAMAAIIDRVVQQRDEATARLVRIDTALNTVSALLADDPGDLTTALATATASLVPGVIDVRFLNPDEVVAETNVRRILADDGVGIDESGNHVSATPMTAGQRTVGALVVTSPHALAESDKLLLRIWADRSATAVLIDAVRGQELEAREELERAAELRRELTARVSHDLKVPLSTVSAAAHTLSKQGDLLSDEQRVRLHDMLYRNAERVRRWIDDLFDDAAAGRDHLLRPAEQDLVALLDEACEASEQTVAAHVVAVDVPEDTRVMADVDAVTRVVSNLLSNAAKFSPVGSRIDITARVHDDQVIVSVTDAGPGIAPEDRDVVFEPWLRRSDDVAGAGLGLANVRNLVRRWGGHVWADSPGQTGARLSFTIPLAAYSLVQIDTPSTDRNAQTLH